MKSILSFLVPVVLCVLVVVLAILAVHYAKRAVTQSQLPLRRLRFNPSCFLAWSTCVVITVGLAHLFLNREGLSHLTLDYHRFYRLAHSLPPVVPLLAGLLYVLKETNLLSSQHAQINWLDVAVLIPIYLLIANTDSSPLPSNQAKGFALAFMTMVMGITLILSVRWPVVGGKQAFLLCGTVLFGFGGLRFLPDPWFPDQRTVQAAVAIISIALLGWWSLHTSASPSMDRFLVNLFLLNLALVILGGAIDLCLAVPIRPWHCLALPLHGAIDVRAQIVDSLRFVAPSFLICVALLGWK